MVAGTPELSDLRKKSGASLLQMTDDVGFGALGAAWVLDVDSLNWHYLLISPMIDSKGPRWVYERLLQVFRKLRLPAGITPLDIVVASPREVHMRNLLAFKSDSLGHPSIRTVVDGGSVNGVEIGYMAIYRMMPMKQDAGERAKKFDAGVKELMAA